jgi:hypothetical protein
LVLENLTIGVFAELMQLKLDGGLATTAWWKNKVQQTIEAWISAKLCDERRVEETRKRFTALANKLTSFLGEYLMKLVEIPTQLFACCSNPDIISMDGIVLSVEQNRIQSAKLSSPWLNNQTSRHRATTRPQRNIIQTTSKADRNLLAAFTKSGITQEELDRLQTSLNSDIFVMIDLVKIQFDGKYHCNEPLQQFFQSCTKQIFPAAHYMPPSVWTTAASVCSNKKVTIAEYYATANDAPMFAAFLAFMMGQRSATAIDAVFITNLQ